MKSLFQQHRTGQGAVAAHAPIVERHTMERTASDLLGSIALALKGFDRNGLVAVSQEFLALSQTHPKKPVVSQPENELREFLRKCALKIYKERPNELGPLEEHLLRKARTDLKGLFE